MSEQDGARTSKQRTKPTPPALTFGKVWDYAPAPESTEEARIAERHGLFVGGEFRAPASGRYAPTIDPATERVLSEVAQADVADVAAAVRAAARAQRDWSARSGDERARFLFRIARLLLERSREFAVLETLDNGKPIRETRDVDVPLAAQHFFYHAGWADKLELAFPGAQPLGVVGQIVPWNFPLLMAAWKIAPALAAGNTVVLKPAPTTPLTALRLCEVFQQAGLPPGVVNVLTGDDRTGQALVRADGLAKIAFTGSTAVGKEIQRTVAGRGVELTLELGGKAAHLVFEDAALDQAVEGVVRGIFFNQGHVCCAGSRLLVQEGVHDQFVDKLCARMQRIRVGDPMDKNTDMGAIHSKAQLQRIRELVDSGVQDGARLVQAECALPARGFWFPPSLFTGVAMTHRIAR
jgi:aldehyde dehydrogenase (NAD+)